MRRLLQTVRPAAQPAQTQLRVQAAPAALPLLAPLLLQPQLQTPACPLQLALLLRTPACPLLLLLQLLTPAARPLLPRLPPACPQWLLLARLLRFLQHLAAALRASRRRSTLLRTRCTLPLTSRMAAPPALLTAAAQEQRLQRPRLRPAAQLHRPLPAPPRALQPLPLQLHPPQPLAALPPARVAHPRCPATALWLPPMAVGRVRQRPAALLLLQTAAAASTAAATAR